jgi:hypothetical protein
MIVLSNWETVERLLAAAALGSLIGFERERLLWAAGIRTQMLVCVGGCLFMLVSAFGFSAALTMDHVVLDPSRIAAQVGIGDRVSRCRCNLGPWRDRQWIDDGREYLDRGRNRPRRGRRTVFCRRNFYGDNPPDPRWREAFRRSVSRPQPKLSAKRSKLCREH